MKTFRWIVLTVLLAVTVSAEMRMWTAEDGSRFWGEFERELLGRLQVRDTAGKVRSIRIDSLSEADINYLESTVPPEIEIDLDRKSRVLPIQKWSIEEDYTTLYTCTVTVRKESKMDSKIPLTAELYLIAEEVDGDNWALMHHEVSKFVFPEGKKSEYVFVAKEVPFRKYNAGWANDGPWNTLRGVTYLGYIIAILDPNENIVAYDTDLNTETWMKELGFEESLKRLRELYLQGRGSAFSRHFDETIKKAAVPQIPWYTRTKTPGAGW